MFQFMRGTVPWSYENIFPSEQVISSRPASTTVSPKICRGTRKCSAPSMDAWLILWSRFGRDSGTIHFNFARPVCGRLKFTRFFLLRAIITVLSWWMINLERKNSHAGSIAHRSYRRIADHRYTGHEKGGRRQFDRHQKVASGKIDKTSGKCRW